MNQPKKSLLLAAFFIFGLSLTNALAQIPTAKPSEPSFDIVLQTVVASNDSGKAEIAPPLSGVVRKLKTDFPFTNYRLTSTAFQRISNRGNLESKSVSYLADNNNLAVFSDWSINGLESSIDEKNQEMIQIQSFRFGQRIPINNTINYEQIGLTTRFSLAKNTPTVIGSLTTSKPDELMFLILTVKSAEK